MLIDSLGGERMPCGDEDDGSCGGEDNTEEEY